MGLAASAYMSKPTRATRSGMMVMSMPGKVCGLGRRRTRLERIVSGPMSDDGKAGRAPYESPALRRVAVEDLRGTKWEELVRALQAELAAPAMPSDTEGPSR